MRIAAYDRATGQLIRRYDGIEHAARDGYDATAISECVAGRRRQHRNLKWVCIGGICALRHFARSQIEKNKWRELPLKEFCKAFRKWLPANERADVTPASVRDALKKLKFELVERENDWAISGVTWFGMYPSEEQDEISHCSKVRSRRGERSISS